LRFYDPVAGEYLRNLPEAEADRLAERAARQVAESENLRLREQLRRLQEQQSTSDSNNDGDSNNDSLPEGGTRP
jgi:regulator of protease activity HflC (stomatin/prohibitin superfamily)